MQVQVRISPRSTKHIKATTQFKYSSLFTLETYLFTNVNNRYFIKHIPNMLDLGGCICPNIEVSQMIPIRAKKRKVYKFFRNVHYHKKDCM